VSKNGGDILRLFQLTKEGKSIEAMNTTQRKIRQGSPLGNLIQIQRTKEN
jgi:hypothetical protein